MKSPNKSKWGKEDFSIEFYFIYSEDNQCISKI